MCLGLLLGSCLARAMTHQIANRCNHFIYICSYLSAQLLFHNAETPLANMIYLCNCPGIKFQSPCAKLQLYVRIFAPKYIPLVLKYNHHAPKYLPKKCIPEFQYCAPKDQVDLSLVVSRDSQSQLKADRRRSRSLVSIPSSQA